MPKAETHRDVESIEAERRKQGWQQCRRGRTRRLAIGMEVLVLLASQWEPKGSSPRLQPHVCHMHLPDCIGSTRVLAVGVTGSCTKW